MADELANDIKAFSKVRAITKKGTFEGLMLPSKEFLNLKLKSGYNIGIDYKNVEKIEKLAEPDLIQEIKQKKRTVSGERILIIHTGGTIASKVDYATGAVHPSYNAEEILLQYPEIEEISPIETVQVSNILSEDLRFSHINKIAEELTKAQNNKEILGVIITHGTDTMHYTASALTYMLSHFNKPVIITGSQRSSDRPSSDSRINILSSALAIKKHSETTLKPSLFICMHKSIEEENAVLIEGLFARKNHSSRRDAFKSINKPYAATININKKSIEVNDLFTQNNTEDKTGSQVTYKKLNEKIKVGFLKAHPNMFPDEINQYKKYDGLIIEGTGFGHLGVSEDIEENNKVYEALKKLAKKIPVFMTKQTINGVTNLSVYSAGRRLLEAGILGDNTDCTSESAYIKMVYLLSNYTAKETKKLMNENLKGEYNEYREVVS